MGGDPLDDRPVFEGYIIAPRNATNGESLRFGYTSLAPTISDAWRRFMGPGPEGNQAHRINAWIDRGYGPRRVRAEARR